MQLTNNGLVTWPKKGAKIILPRGPGLASSHNNSAKEDGFFDGTFSEDLKNLTSHS